MIAHERRHGAASSPELVREAAKLHEQLHAAFLFSFHNPADRARILKVSRRAYRRFLRRHVRLANQTGEWS
jgi:hypothetical protein